MLKQEPMTPDRVRLLPALSLAHLGDAVFELLVRAELCAGPAAKNGSLHRQTVACVCAPAQAAVADRILPLLTEEELGFYRRGRNAQFGALYLLGRDERLQTLFEAGKEPKNAV